MTELGGRRGKKTRKLRNPRKSMKRQRRARMITRRKVRGGVFGFGEKSAVAPRPVGVRTGSVLESVLKERYEASKQDVEALLSALETQLSAKKEEYDAKFGNDKRAWANAATTEKVMVDLSSIGSLEKTVAAVKALLRVYAKDPSTKIDSRLSKYSAKAKSLAKTLKDKVLGTETTDSLLDKLSQNQLTLGQLAMLHATVAQVKKDADSVSIGATDPVESGTGAMGGGETEVSHLIIAAVLAGLVAATGFGAIFAAGIFIGVLQFLKGPE